LKPSYMSVTYGAGGSTKGHTIRLAGDIQKKFSVPTIAHLTCVCATKESIEQALSQMKEAGIENILALRGDVPKDFEGNAFTDFTHASELVKLIKENGDFCVGGACYPEIHPDSASKPADIEGLKKKVEAGCEYLTTQMFFDNNIFFNFMYRVREAGITVPIIPGIMPITRQVQVKNAVKLSGCNVPERFKNIVDRFGDTEAAMKQAGIAYATDQIIDLIANGVKHIHVYSMNKPEVAKGIQDNLSEIIRL
ncbi:MAG: methylenetetrahydrofolate reductase, partial [Lachnospira sp.]|nr:methylenetetrahydrofolate reductase [Lachnospira sp.]